MSGYLGAAAILFIAYVLGAIPVGLIVGRLAGGVDLRQHGSRRTGSTNALRTLGLRWAVMVFLLDIGKGVVAVLLARWLYQAGPPGSPEWVAAGAGVAAIAGHNWSAFIGFTGGRGVATAGGALLALAPIALLVAAGSMAVVVAVTRYVSLGSLAAAAAAPLAAIGLVLMGRGEWGTVGYAIAAALLIVASHRDNIDRLRAGTERKLGRREPAA